jgi:hypothetical protein
VENTVVLIGGDLNDRARLETAAGRSGLKFERAGSLAAALELDPQIVVLDLDGSDPGLLEEVASSPRLPRIVGYFSHVDEDLGRRALDAGCEAFARGEFWRSLDSILRPTGA